MKYGPPIDGVQVVDAEGQVPEHVTIAGCEWLIFAEGGGAYTAMTKSAQGALLYEGELYQDGRVSGPRGFVLRTLEMTTWTT